MSSASAADPAAAAAAGEHVPFPSIEQFRHFVKDLAYLREHAPDLEEELELHGTPKLHGTHADIVAQRPAAGGGGARVWWCQSRNRVLTPESDNIGFACFMASRGEAVARVLDAVEEACGGGGAQTVIAGEFCGGSIQKRVALTRLPQMFVILGVRVDGVWQDMSCLAHVADEPAGILNIRRAPVLTLRIRSACPEASEAALRELAEQATAQCPFAKTFDVVGAGEGIVWTCPVLAARSRGGGSRWWFKVKGAEFDTVAYARRPRPGNAAADAEVDAEAAAAREFAVQVTPLPRLEQGLAYLTEMGKPHDAAHMGDFLRWVVGDVLKEEGDILAGRGLDAKAVRFHVGRIARAWYANRSA